MSSQETFSISELQRMCTRSEYLEESDIQYNDKTVSWDGNIIFYKNKKPKATGNEYCIPVQVKGKKFDKLPEGNNIGYPAKTRDLNNYLKNGGVLFFVCAIEEESYRTKMFAKILLPIDLIKIIKNKQEQKKITIYLNYVKTIKELEQLCLLFCENKPKQSFIGINEPIAKIQDGTQIVISTLPGKYTNPGIAIVKNSLKYFYIKKDGIEIPIPIKGLITSFSDYVNIQIGDTINEIYPVRYIFKKESTICLINEVIEITFYEENDQITIRCLECSDVNFQTVFNTSKILVTLPEASDVFIGNIHLNKESIEELSRTFNDEFLNYHKRIITLGQILDKLNLPKDRFKTIEVLESEAAINFLYSALVKGEIVDIPLKNKKDSGIYRQLVGNQKILLEYKKVRDNGYKVRNFLAHDNNVKYELLTKENKLITINRWFLIRGKDVQYLIFDEDDLLQAMKQIEEEEIGSLLGLIFDCLHAYDKDQNNRMLALAEKLFSIFEQYCNGLDLTTIIKCEIILRNRELNEEEKKELLEIKYSDNIFCRCCVCILLQQFDEFDIQKKQLTEEEKIELYSWPIINFLQNKKIEDND